MDRITIRKARLTDATTVAPLLAELGYPAEEDDVRERLARLLESANDVVLLAVRGGLPIGLAVVHVMPVVHANDPIGWIMAFVVAGEERGRGVGRQLVAAIEAAARELGCARLMVTSAERRGGAHAFYQRLGYEYTGRRFAKQLR